MAKLTKRTVEAARSGDTDFFVWDDRIAGFGLRIRSSGKRTFIVQYRTPEGRQPRRVLGHYPVLTADQARDEAKEWLRNARRGDDPALARDKSRRAATLTDLCERYGVEHADLHKKDGSIAEDRRIAQVYIMPALGHNKAVSVSTEDVARLHKSMRGTPYMANRTLALLSAVFNRAEREMRQLRADWINPCRGVRRYQEEKRRRYLAPAELARLGKVLAAATADGLAAADAVAAIRLLIFTGCRRSEVLTLKWDQVDLGARRLRLADSKTGAKDIHLSPPAIKVLQGIEPAEGNPYVFPGRVAGSHMKDLKHAWPKIRERAKLEDVRVHDLRHSFASVGAGAGLSLPIIGALLGHSQPATTARYAHLASDPLQEAVDLVGARLADALDGGEGGEVIPLHRTS